MHSFVRLAVAGVVPAAAAAFFLQGVATGDATTLPMAPRLHPRVLDAYAFGVSPRVADLPPAFSGSGQPGRVLDVAETLQPGDGVDGALQSAVVPSLMPSPLVSFDGLGQQDNLQELSISVFPSDVTGDIGPHHYVQQTNLLARVFDRSGTPLTNPFRLSSLFSSLPAPCSTHDSGGLPFTLYDSLADRWLLSQLALASATEPHLCIAISQTPDPTGAYHVYDFAIDQFETVGRPKFGVWPDGYYASIEGAFAGTIFSTSAVFAFDRQRMLAGQAAQAIEFTLPTFPAPLYGLRPSDFDGHIVPPAGAPNTFVLMQANEFGYPADGLRLFDFHADFTTPANSSFLERPESSLAAPLAVAAFDPTSPSARRDIEQPPPATSTHALDSVSDVLMVRLQYRNFGASESLVITHTVGAPASTTLGVYRAGIRYYQIARPIGGTYAVVEQATFAPADGVSRWIGSAAADHQGNIAVGYSVANVATFPSLRYAGRLATDSPGGLFQGEATLVAGTGAQTSTSNRWGEVSAMSIDPIDDCTFWFTGQYYAASGTNWLTRVGAFRFSACTPVTPGTLQGVVRRAGTNNPVPGATVAVSNGFITLTTATGDYSRWLPTGTYSVTVSKIGFVPQTFHGITIVAGQVTLLDVLLQPAPVIVAHSQSILTESLTPNNGVIDPGEEVTVTLGLRNDGTVPTTNLVATLRATAEVLQPSGPVAYGAIFPIVSATGQFSFRATPVALCGAPVVVTLDLTDGALHLGAVSFTFTAPPAHQCPFGSRNFVRNPSFTLGADGSDHWLKFALPDSTGMTWNVTGGVFQFYRTGTQAVVFQPTGVPVPALTPLEAAFSLGNTTTVRKRVSVLIHDLDFTDLFVCTFWIPPDTPFQSHLIRTHTTKAWANATISFYAANAGNEGNGFYRLDNVQLYTGIQPPTSTECVAPLPPFQGTPAPPNVNLLVNGDFGSGTLPPWILFGQIVGQVSGGVFEFYRPAGTPAGVILQSTNQAVAQGQTMTAMFQLGNSSSVRKRVTVLLHDSNFNDLGACTFWLEPGAPLADFRMTFIATNPWANATASFYAATIGTQQWIRLDNITFMAQLGGALASTECVEPGG
jgi:hypothetical protein